MTLEGEQRVGNMSDEMLLAAICLALSILLFILVIMLWFRLRSLHRKYENMMAGAGVDNLQELITHMQQQLQTLHQSDQETAAELKSLQHRMSKLKGNIAIQRYNAFNEKGHGSDLSFSLALLDDQRNGVILTAIHGRSETYMYGKPVENGESRYTLSPEEKQVLETAMQQSKP